MIRLFTAIELSGPMKNFLRSFYGGLKGARWTSDENLHLTLQFIGEVNGKEKAEFIANAKAILLYTRLPDAAPRVISESLISGTPIIGSINGALPELIRDGKTGILCSDERDLPKAILSVKKIKSQDCHDYAADKFSCEKSAENYLQIYKSML